MSSAIYLPDAAISTLVDQIIQLPREKDDIVLLLVGEHAQLDIQELRQTLDQQGVPIVGGIFPGIIYGTERHETGIVADVLPLAAPITLVTGLNESQFHIETIPDFSHSQNYTALTLVDGLTPHVASFLTRLFRIMRNRVRYIGGGAGSLSFVQKPCLFDNQGIYQDAALVIWLKSTVSLGIQHGWQRLRGPLVATKTSGNIVHLLSNQPAFHVYQDAIRGHKGKKIEKENFFSIAKEYPLGIYHLGMDYIVRDPISVTDEGSLVCVGEVPNGSLIYILQGEKESLIQHAHKATQDAMSSVSQSHHNLIVDCISRVLYLEDDYTQELDAVIAALPDRSPLPYGVLSLGEIASFMTGRLEFFNKTFVVGALQDVCEPSLAPVELNIDKRQT